MVWLNPMNDDNKNECDDILTTEKGVADIAETPDITE